MPRYSPRAIIVCDFDGSITIQDTCDSIMKRFADPEWVAIGKLYDQEKIDHYALNSRFARIIRASQTQLEAHLRKTIDIRYGFRDFCLRSRKQNIGIMIASGGWRINIETLLIGYELTFPTNNKNVAKTLNNPKTIPCVCGNVVFNVKTEQWEYQSNWKKSKKSSVDKAAIIKELKKSFGKPVYLIGDGSTDEEAAEIADHTIAFGALAEFCSRKKIKHTKVETFGQAWAAIAKEALSPINEIVEKKANKR